MNFNPHYKSWIFKFFPSYIDAITLPWGIYFREEKEQVDPVVMNHERIHVEQINRIGVIKFYFQYLCEYLFNLAKYRNSEEAYKNISFEIEAYLKQWQ